MIVPLHSFQKGGCIHRPLDVAGSQQPGAQAQHDSIQCTCKRLLISLWAVEVPLGDIWAVDADLADLASGQLLVLLVQDGYLQGHKPRSLLAPYRQQASAGCLWKSRYHRWLLTTLGLFSTASPAA